MYQLSFIDSLINPKTGEALPQTFYDILRTKPSKEFLAKFDSSVKIRTPQGCYSTDMRNAAAEARGENTRARIRKASSRER